MLYSRHVAAGSIPYRWSTMTITSIHVTKASIKNWRMYFHWWKALKSAVPNCYHRNKTINTTSLSRRESTLYLTEYSCNPWLQKKMRQYHFFWKLTQSLRSGCTKIFRRERLRWFYVSSRNVFICDVIWTHLQITRGNDHTVENNN